MKEALKQILTESDDQTLKEVVALAQEIQGVRNEAFLVRYQENMNNLLRLLYPHKDLVMSVLAPKHETINCSDEKRESAYIDHGVPRCTRCFLLEAFGPPTNWPDGAIIERVEVKLV